MCAAENTKDIYRKESAWMETGMIGRETGMIRLKDSHPRKGEREAGWTEQRLTVQRRAPQKMGKDGFTTGKQKK